MGMSALAKLSEKYGLEEAKLVDTLRATVIKSKRIRGRDGKPDTYVPASIEEVNAGLMVAAHYDLDPLLKQIHFFPAEGGGIVPIVGYDGWIKLVNREKRFAGFRSIDNVDGSGNLISITGIMKVWVDQPGGEFYEVQVTEYLEECRRDTEPWKKWPRRMLRNKTYNQTARMAFGFSGLYDEDEGQRALEAMEAAAIDVTPVKVPQALPKSSSSTIPGAQGAEKGASPASQEPAGSTQVGGAQGTPSPSADPAKAAGGASPAGAVSDAPKTDAEKKAYIASVIVKAAKQFNVTESQVLYDLSKFLGKDKQDPSKEVEVGVTALDDPRLAGRWLNKVYGEAKRLEAEIDNGPM